MSRDMARRSLEKMVRRWALMVGCVPLVMLAGCPQSETAAPGTTPAQTIAPTLTSGSSSAGQAPQPIVSTEQSVDSAARAFKVQQLINSAEAAYKSGVDSYRAGHLDAARVDFDSAVDLMLTSGMNLKTDPQLADEFDHLLNAVNSLEMAALKQGNGFSPVLEAAPLDAANEVTFPANAALTAKVAAELKTTQSDFPLVVNDYVAGFISYFSNSAGGHAHLLRSLERAGKYKEMISKNLRDQGVPQDLIYLAVAESGFQPQALNARSGAGGMWQFMPTGAYGLARNGWVDERFDPEKSSVAYAKYMKTLYNQFGDWYLAMAAYDWGPGNVQRAVMKTGYADFWELYRRNVLPAETKNYVPGIIAAIIMAKNPEQYGLDKMVPEAAVVSDRVTVDYSIDLRLVADVTETSLPEIVALNPSLLRMTTPRDTSFDLHIPVGMKDVFATRIKEIPEEKRSSWRFHVVRGGESLDGIAAALHAHASDIAEANGLTTGGGVDTGDELVIPVANAPTSSHPQRYAVRRGDTLITVADRFGVSVEDLRRWNHLSSNSVSLGRSLTVAEPVKLAPGTHVHGRGRGSKSSPHTTKSFVHEGSTHVDAKYAAAKPSRPASTTGKSSDTAKQSGTSKTKRKATR
jgi:membrane-bound lytic murein transglycosylase D